MRDKLGYKVRRGFPAAMFLAVWVAFVIVSAFLLDLTRRNYYFFFEQNRSKIISVCVVVSLALLSKAGIYLFLAIYPYQTEDYIKNKLKKATT